LRAVIFVATIIVITHLIWGERSVLVGDEVTITLDVQFVKV